MEPLFPTCTHRWTWCTSACDHFTPSVKSPLCLDWGGDSGFTNKVIQKRNMATSFKKQHSHADYKTRKFVSLPFSNKGFGGRDFSGMTFTFTPIIPRILAALRQFWFSGGKKEWQFSDRLAAVLYYSSVCPCVCVSVFARVPGCWSYRLWTWVCHSSSGLHSQQNSHRKLSDM